MVIRRRIDVKPISDYGIILGVYPSSDPSYDIELQRTSGGGSTFARLDRLDIEQAKRFQYRDYLPNDNLVYKYRGRHVGDGVADGGWTNTVSARPALLPEGDIPTPPISLHPIEVSMNLEELSGNALAKVGGLLSHAESNVAADGDSVSFASTFTAPKVWFVPEGAATYTTAISGRQRADVSAQNLTGTGFTMRAKLLGGGTGKACTDYFSTALNSTQSSGGQSISTDTARIYASLGNATTVAATYTAHYAFYGSSMEGTALGRAKLYYNAGAASTSWTLANQKLYGQEDSTGETLSFSAALGSSYDVALELVYQGTPATGARLDGQWVTYTAISTAVQEQSMTTGAGEGFRWFAVEAP